MMFMSHGTISMVKTTVQASHARDEQWLPERVSKGKRNLGWGGVGVGVTKSCLLGSEMTDAGSSRVCSGL